MLTFGVFLVGRLALLELGARPTLGLNCFMIRLGTVLWTAVIMVGWGPLVG